MDAIVPLMCEACGAGDVFPAFSVVGHGQPMEIVKYPMPTPMGTEVLVRTTFAGVCHSDVHLWQGYFDVGGGVKMPVRPVSREQPHTLGHEFEGLIVAAGEQVPLGEFDMQKSYAVFPWIGCNRPEECRDCASGNTQFCRSAKTQRFIDGKSIYGGYSSHLLIPHFKYLIDYEGAVPRGLGGVYMCSGLTAFSALECAFTSRNPPQAPEDLVIIGCGGLGMQCLCMAIAKHGAPLVCDIDDAKLSEAARLGCRTVNCGRVEASEEILQASNGGVATVIDFVGNEKSYAFADKILRVGGKIVLVGLLGGKMESSLPEFALRAKCLEGNFVGNLRQTHEMLDLMRTGKVPILPHHFRSIFEMNDAMQDLVAGKYLGRCVLKHDWHGADGSKM